MRKPTPSEERALLWRSGPRTVNRWRSGNDRRYIPVDAAVRLWAACGETWTEGASNG